MIAVWKAADCEFAVPGEASFDGRGANNKYVRVVIDDTPKRPIIGTNA